MTEAIKIPLLHIALRPLLSPRNGISFDIVHEYLINVDDLPPVLVAIDGARTGEYRSEPVGSKTYVLIDGWHRYHAHSKAGHKSIMAIVDYELKPDDFYFAAVCANKTHGIRFTANEKKTISRQLFIQENRTAAEISNAIGCSLRHATDLIKDLAAEKKETAIQLAKRMSKQGISQRDIAADLKRRGFKTSKSSVDRWLKPEVEVPQIGESPKRDTEQLVNEVSLNKEKLSRMRSNLASAQSINIESEGLDSERIKKLYWSIEDALTHVKALQESLEDNSE